MYSGYELYEHLAVRPGSEEYLDSEKYQLRHWDLDDPRSLAPFIAQVNAIRRAHPALQSNERLTFHETENDRLIAYSKRTAAGADRSDPGDAIVTVVNLDPHHPQAGMLSLPLEDLGIDPSAPYEVHDLLSGATYRWEGRRNYVGLDPAIAPGHVFELRQRVHTEAGFDLY
jgi:starch synthase (maltosyl-transferring)